MEFKVLAVGDVVGNPGMDRIRRHLRQLKRKTGADFVIVNGENAAVVGMTPDQGEDILDAGADCITMGNHTWGKREIVDYMDDCPQIIRPANYAPQVPGRGWQIFETKAGDVAVIDLIGRCGMDYTPDNPFLLVEKILKKTYRKIIVVCDTEEEKTLTAQSVLAESIRQFDVEIMRVELDSEMRDRIIAAQERQKR